VSVQPLRSEDAALLKPKDLAHVDFYRFQMREAKREQIADLRRVMRVDAEIRDG
jgi:ribosomal RNA-processing protein 7